MISFATRDIVAKLKRGCTAVLQLLVVHEEASDKDLTASLSGLRSVCIVYAVHVSAVRHSYFKISFAERHEIS